MDTVLLIVRCAHQSSADQKIEAQMNWTVLELKTHLAKNHPGKPEVSQQRLIYSGHLLKDSATIRSFLRSYDEDESGDSGRNSGQHVIHLVHTPTVEQLRLQKEKTGDSFAGKTRPLVNSSSGSTIEPRDGVRNRRGAPSSSPAGVVNVSLNNSTIGSNDSANTNAPVYRQPTSYAINPYFLQNGAMMGNFGANLNAGTQQQANFTPTVPQGENYLTGSADASQPAISDILIQSQQMYSMYMSNYMSYLAQLYGGAGFNPMTQMGMMVQPMSNPGYPNASFGFPSAVANPLSSNLATGVPSAQPDPVGNENGAAVDAQNRPVEAPAANAVPVAPQPAPAAEQVMNAQGGVDEEDWRERDWLDWIYVVIRASFLGMILYFYSSWERFLVVLCISSLIYAYQNGWFGRHSDQDARRIVQVRPPNNDNNNNNIANEEGEENRQNDDGNIANDRDESEPRPSTSARDSPSTSGAGNDNEDTVPESQTTEDSPAGPASAGNAVPLPYDPDASNWQIFWSTCYTFITSFFASLVPERPPPLN